MSFEDFLNEEEKVLWRNTERQLELLETCHTRSAGQIAALIAEGRETSRRLRELGEATDARIVALISEIQGKPVRE